jgi:hypothetical protein
MARLSFFAFRPVAAPAAVVVLAASAALLPAASPGAAAVSKEEGVAAFETVRAVLQHPRCQNCHIPGDAPLQLDAGVTHAMGVRRGAEGKGAPGLACATCHGSANLPASYGAGVPPGAPNWHLPPPARKMVFIGLSSGDLCRGLKDVKQNGGKNLDALVRHMSEDKLVLWGWHPGVGREPVSVPHDELVAKLNQWVAAGAPCAP